MQAGNRERGEGEGVRGAGESRGSRVPPSGRLRWSPVISPSSSFHMENDSLPVRPHGHAMWAPVRPSRPPRPPRPPCACVRLRCALARLAPARPGEPGVLEPSAPAVRSPSRARARACGLTALLNQVSPSGTSYSRPLARQALRIPTGLLGPRPPRRPSILPVRRSLQRGILSKAMGNQRASR